MNRVLPMIAAPPDQQVQRGDNGPDGADARPAGMLPGRGRNQRPGCTADKVAGHVARGQAVTRFRLHPVNDGLVSDVHALHGEVSWRKKGWKAKCRLSVLMLF